MVFSTQKPARIVILSMQDDIRNGKCTVRYAFRFAVQEAPQTEVTYDEQGNPVEQTISGWQYEEVVDEMTIPLYMKPTLAVLLQSVYDSITPILEANLSLASTEIPKQIE